jgi:hypothetical protein
MGINVSMQSQLGVRYSSLCKKKWGKPLVLGERKGLFKDAIQRLVQRWQKCIEVGGDIVEK